MKDNHPYLEKLKTTRKIFELLNIQEEPEDFSEKSPSGGGSTVTKHALTKILNRLFQLRETGKLSF